MLTLSNRTGGDGDVYIRTGRASVKNQLAAGAGWEPWGKLQQNIEVGQVTSLDTFTGNGIYSGVYTNGNTFFETFVMVVINNYVVAGATGQVRSISQFKYALNVDGTFSYKTRTGQGNSVIEWGSWVDLGAADTTDIQDGTITAQKLSSDVREKVDNPLRPLFIAAGAEYNDTGVDITKTAPWGETVTHKAGHYYLNGLGDITEDEMVEIYSAGKVDSTMSVALYRNLSLRTNLVTTLSGGEGRPLSMYYLCNNARKIQVFNNTSNDTTTVNSIHTAFAACILLKYIIPIINVSGVTSATEMEFAFLYCSSLILCKIKNLKYSLSFSNSPLISKESILYTIQNAQPTAAITITLHADAYARLVDDADIVAALEAQPLISLVSA